MPWSFLTIPLLLPAYLLVLFRVGGLMIAAPIFGSRTVPQRVRVLFAASISLMLFPVLLPTIPAHLTLPTALVGAASEMMIGVVMGLAVNLLFLGAQLAGTVIGQQAGLSLGQTYNPMIDSNSTVLGQLYFIVLLMAFLALGGHRALMSGLLDSFRAVPLLSFSLERSHVDLLVELLQSAFILGLKLAGPALIALLMATVTMGLLSKTMPQLNILSVGFVVRILAVLFIAGLSLSAAQGVLSAACFDTIRAIRAAFGLD